MTFISDLKPDCRLEGQLTFTNYSINKTTLMVINDEPAAGAVEMSTQPGRTGARTRSAEPAFDTAIGDLALPRHPTTTTISTAAPAAPPPAYGGPGLPLSRTVSSGRTLTNPRRSAIVKLAWASHPALGGSWLAAPVRLIRYLRMEGEVVSSQFPDEFTEVLDASAGVTEDDIRKAEQLFEARVNHLNKWIIADALALTRFWMAFLLVFYPNAGPLSVHD